MLLSSSSSVGDKLSAYGAAGCESKCAAEWSEYGAVTVVSECVFNETAGYVGTSG